MTEEIKNLKCEFCSYITDKKYNLTRHIKSHNLSTTTIKENIEKQLINNQNDNTICYKCNKSFSNKYSLIRHSNICKGVSSSFECHYCNKKFKSLQSKHVHIKKCKIKYEEKQLIENKKKENKKEENKKEETHIINNISINNGLINNNITNVIIFDPNNINNSLLKTDHINLEFINKLLKIKEKDALTLYTKKIFDNPDNRCIKKTNLRSMFSQVHIGENKWNTWYDTDIYPKFISEISNCLGDLLISKIPNRNIINKLLEFIDYMAEDGYCNNDEISEEIKKEYKKQIQKTKAIIYDISKFLNSF
jgi:hypothetical protein